MLPAELLIYSVYGSTWESTRGRRQEPAAAHSVPSPPSRRISNGAVSVTWWLRVDGVGAARPTSGPRRRPEYDSDRHKRKMLRRLTPEQVLAESGSLRVNEVLDYFPQLLKDKKTKAAFDYFNRTFSRNPDQDLAKSLRKEGQTDYSRKK